MTDEEKTRRDRRFREEIPDQKLRDWYKRYYQHGLSLEAIGRRVGVNPRVLSKLFKEAGLPVTAKLENRILADESLENEAGR
jgi:AraC-like DNA-binding protein